MIFLRDGTRPKKLMSLVNFFLDLCLRVMNDLTNCGIIIMDGPNVAPTEAGKIMAKYYVSLFSMKVLMNVSIEFV
jgi:hypothetical protein